MEKTKLAKLKKLIKNESVIYWIVDSKMYQTWRGIINDISSSKLLPHGECTIVEVSKEEFEELRELGLITTL